MSLYIHNDYRLGITYCIERMKNRRPAFTQTKLAEKSGIHNTFISNVLKGRSDFHPDQIFSLGEALELTSDEIDFLVLLLEEEKSVHPHRKAQLGKQITEVKQEKLKLGNQLALDKPDFSMREDIEYYLNPYYMIVHVALSLPQYAKSLELLAKHMKLSPEYVRGVAKRLEQMQFIDYETKTKAYKVRTGSKHLDKDSPLCIPHQTMLRNQGLRHLGEVDNSRRTFFSATFLGDDNLRKAIEKEFYQFTKVVKKLVDQNKNQTGVFQLNFDLFPWTEG